MAESRSPLKSTLGARNHFRVGPHGDLLVCGLPRPRFEGSPYIRLCQLNVDEALEFSHRKARDWLAVQDHEIGVPFGSPQGRHCVRELLPPEMALPERTGSASAWGLSSRGRSR